MVSAVILASAPVDRIEESVLESALASDLHEIVCVVRDVEAVRHRISPSNDRLFWLPSPAADQEQSSFVIAGLWAIDPKSQGVLFLPGDRPMIHTDLINSLLKRFENTNAPIVAASFRGQIGDPILFRRDLFPKLLQLTGNQSGGILIKKYRKKTALVEWNDEVFLKNDIDVRDDYEKID